MDAHLTKGTVLAGKYEVERVIGQGGMGCVVAARHRELDDRVAIKFLLPEMASRPEVVARFLTEARAARKLKTEHVARVSDVGTLPETGAPFMVMDLLEGCDLASLVAKQGRLPVEQAVEYVLQGAVAVAEAHLHGIIHRDLKPANLFLTRRPDGTPCVKVLDFGIAKITGGDAAGPSLTQQTGMMGTALYAAPEQLQSAKLVDNRCDIWSLGVTLYELTTGAFPFDGDDLGMLIGQILTMPHVPIQSRVPGLPPGFARAIDRALEKPRDARFRTVAELADAVSPFGGGDSARSAQAIHRILGVTDAPADPPPPTPVAAASSPTIQDAAASATVGMSGSTEAGKLVAVATAHPSVTDHPTTSSLKIAGIVGVALAGAIAVALVVTRHAPRARRSAENAEAAAAIATRETDPTPLPAESQSPPESLAAVSPPDRPAKPSSPSHPIIVPPHAPPAAGPVSDVQKAIATCRGKMSPLDAKTEKMIRQLEQSDSPEDRRQAREARQQARAQLKVMCDELRAQGLL